MIIPGMIDIPESCFGEIALGAGNNPGTHGASAGRYRQYAERSEELCQSVPMRAACH